MTVLVQVQWLLCIHPEAGSATALANQRGSRSHFWPEVYVRLCFSYMRLDVMKMAASRNPRKCIVKSYKYEGREREGGECRVM
ncbi:hypothetical protein IQ06DRAFT_52734 [Phaeosphaeriaceae sp. SRC1lsM3a]|nr:hypothetical protein IQ06DRAFT_52734 [Stagonospora sp. SRC1lsM3a]